MADNKLSVDFRISLAGIRLCLPSIRNFGAGGTYYLCPEDFSRSFVRQINGNFTIRAAISPRLFLMVSSVPA